MIEELEIGESDETLQDIIGQIEKFKAELNFSLELGAAATDQSAVVIRVPVPLEQDRPSFEGSSPPQSYEAERHLQIEPNPSLDSSASRGGIDSHGAGSATDLPAGASGPDSYGGGSSASTSLLGSAADLTAIASTSLLGSAADLTAIASTSLLGSAADLTAIGSAHGEIYRSDDAHDALGFSTLLASQIDMPPTHDALGFSTLLASQIDMPPTSSSGFRPRRPTRHSPPWSCTRLPSSRAIPVCRRNPWRCRRAQVPRCSSCPMMSSIWTQGRPPLISLQP
jgi:hypothetical protein